MLKQKVLRKRISNIVLTGLLILVLLVMSGCGTLERLTGKDNSDEKTIGGWIGDKPVETNPVPVTASPTETLTIDLYFPDNSGKYLIKEERIIPKTLSVARESVNQWLSGPKSVGTAATPVTSSTVLLDIGIKEGLATVDLSREFLEPINTISPETRLFGLVNTIAQFPTVKQVRLRIEGQNLANFAGIDTSNLTFNQKLIQGELASGNVTFEVSKPQSQDSTPVIKDSPSKIDLFGFPNNTI